VTSETKPSLTLGRDKMLKSRKEIDEVFGRGQKIKSGPLLAFVLQNNNEKTRIGVSVPKRNFKKAVDRNRIKRLLRESYRLNQVSAGEISFQAFFLFVGRKMPTQAELDKHLLKILQVLRD
jgi:ribonuclease P protein component